MRVAVTGATGFVGRRLCAALLAAGHEVRALARRDDHGLGDAVRVIRGDLSDANALRQLTQNVEHVVHCAGAVRGLNRQAFDAVNVDGTQALLQAMIDTQEEKTPGPRLILLSSLAAREPQLSHYAASKRAAERLLDRAPISCVILRPTAIYGPGDVEMLPLLESMASGLAPVPGRRDHRVTLIHVDDVVAAILAALETEAVTPGPYELCDPIADGYDWPQLAEIVGAHCQRRVHLLVLPRALMKAIAACLLAGGRLLGKAPMLTPAKVNELTHPSWACDPGPFIDATGWRPAIDLATGLGTVLNGDP